LQAKGRFTQGQGALVVGTGWTGHRGTELNFF
jgi:hypothetical protein